MIKYEDLKVGTHLKCIKEFYDDLTVGRIYTVSELNDTYKMFRLSGDRDDWSVDKLIHFEINEGSPFDDLVDRVFLAFKMKVPIGEVIFYSNEKLYVSMNFIQIL